MQHPRLARAAIALSLLVTSLLWILALLFKLRMLTFFHSVLLKAFGPIVILGAMVVCPLVAVIVGVRLMRRKQSSLLSVAGVVVGSVFLLLFLFVIGWPMVSGAINATPRNPSTPRPIPREVGLPIFPGAEGFGTLTPAGRKGKVIEVVTLADHGPGSLRAALNDPAPRVIVFRVGGTIQLEESLMIQHPFVTVAGQSAPGGGICLKDAGIVITTHDVLIQHLRVRPGNQGSVEPEVNDAIAILGKHGNVSGAHRVVLDHVSCSWGEDETVSVWYGAHDITISHCIISEALNRSRHEKGTHGAGLIIGDGSYHVSVHHCLLAHNDFRNPLISAGGTHDIVNNVIYNWGNLPTEIVDPAANTFLNFIGNFYRRGPSSLVERFEIVVNPSRKYGIAQPKIFVEGNLSPHRSDPSQDDWALVGFGWSDREPAPESMRASVRFATQRVTSTDAKTAFQEVLVQAGANQPRRDLVDQRVVQEVRDETGRIIDSPQDVGGYPSLPAGTPPVDSDHDGMPDAWELQRDLDPEDPQDAALDRDHDGYTNIEEYLHQIVIDAP